MFDLHKIQQICKLSKEEKWPYPKTFEALKAAGVQSYEVQLNPYTIVYKGESQQWKEPTPAIESFKISSKFNKNGIVETLNIHRIKKTTYLEFLKGIAAAGVSHYIVDMNQRHVAYHGYHLNDCYVEGVPSP